MRPAQNQLNSMEKYQPFHKNVHGTLNLYDSS